MFDDYSIEELMEELHKRKIIKRLKNNSFLRETLLSELSSDDKFLRYILNYSQFKKSI